MKLESISVSMNLTIEPLNLRLKHPFGISRGTTTVQNNVLVTVKDKDGDYGLGEAAPGKYYGEDVQGVQSALLSLSESLPDDPLLCIEHISDKLRGSARAALDIALYDLMTKKQGVPLYKYLGLNPDPPGITSFTIGLDSIDVMCKKVDEAGGEFPVLKVKLGVKDDLELLGAIRRRTDAAIRVDANAGWTVEEAIQKINALKDYGVEFVEQPIPPGNIDGLKRVRDSVALPVIVDEDVRTSADILPLAGAVDGINIKLMKCGGITEALRMINIARAHGLKIMLGCMIESSVSITAAAHLSPLVDYADLDGNILIADDPFTGVTVERGRLILPEGDGLGIGGGE